MDQTQKINGLKKPENLGHLAARFAGADGLGFRGCGTCVLLGTQVCKKLGHVTVASEACPDYLTVTCTCDERGFAYSLRDKRAGPFSQADQNKGDFYERIAKELGCLEKHIVAASLRVSRQIYSKQLGANKGCGLCENFKQLACPHPDRRSQNDETCPAFVLQFMDEQGKLIPARIASSILDSKDLLLVTLEDTKEIVCYHAEKGIWKRDGEIRLQEHVQRIVSKKNPQNEKLSTHTMAETTAQIRWQTFVERSDFNPPENMVCVKNGVLNLDTRELLPFDPSYGFRNAIPVEYDPTATCPEIDRFLEKVVPKKTTICFEFGGYCLRSGQPQQRAGMIYGPGDNGKSTFLNLLKAFLGPENVSSRTIQSIIGNRFAAADLSGKLANIHSDLPDTILQQTGTFKTLTGNDTLTGEFKFQTSFEFVNQAKLIFACNALPESVDDSDAFVKRWLLIPFIVRIQQAEQDKNLLAKLTTPQELSGFLNKAIDAYNEVLRRKHFTDEGTIEEKRETYKRLSDSIGCFIDDMLEFDPDKYEIKDVVYLAFEKYRKENGFNRSYKPNKFHPPFKEKVRATGNYFADTHTKDITGDHRIYRGLFLKVPKEPTPAPETTDPQQKIDPQKDGTGSTGCTGNYSFDPANKFYQKGGIPEPVQPDQPVQVLSELQERLKQCFDADGRLDQQKFAVDCEQLGQDPTTVLEQFTKDGLIFSPGDGTIRRSSH